MMQRKLVLSVAAVFAFTACLQAGYIEEFTNDSAGWKVTTINNGGNVKYHQPVYNSTGGYISYYADNPGNRLYGFEPSAPEVFGELGGAELAVDYKIDGSISYPSDAKVRFYVGVRNGGYNYFVSNDAHSFSPNVSTDWQSFGVDLQEENFLRWPNQDAHNKTFEQVLDGVEDIGLVFCGEFDRNSTLGVTGLKNTEIAIDNFGTITGSSVPEPSTVLLLGLSSVFLLKGKNR